MVKKTRQCKPFLKWAGGKGQLIEQIASYLPENIRNKGKIDKYFEPFLGGGALFFWLAENFDITYARLYEINYSVAICYTVIQQNVNNLIDILKEMESEYLDANAEDREKLYYQRRDDFNKLLRDTSHESHLQRAAHLIFLNKTCYNGLYRVNSKGLFNVPFGKYKNPCICNEENLLAVSELLQKVDVINGDFADCVNHADESSFVYFDPPYRPISSTSSFNTYSKDVFDDMEQKRLRKVFGDLDIKGSNVMLSNSDPKNINPADDFFDDLYKDYRIERLKASRMINCNSEKRGTINEILVMNYS